MGKNSPLTLTLYAVGVFAVLIVGRLAFLSYRDPVADSSSVQPHTVFKPAPRSRLPPVSNHGYTEALQRVREIQISLSHTQRLLENRNSLLSKKTAQNDALRRELNESIDFFLSVLSEDESLSQDDQATARQLQEELLGLRTALQESTQSQQEQLDQLASLQNELTQTNEQLLNSQLAAEEELDSLYRYHHSLSAAVTNALVDAGQPSIAALTTLLRDEEADIRIWAAGVLERMGLDAEEAAPVLIELLQDPDPGVRLAAERALQKVDP